MDDETAFDPTDTEGKLLPEISYLGVIKVPTTLARINEPPIGKDCNVYTKVEVDGSVEIVAER